MHTWPAPLGYIAGCCYGGFDQEAGKADCDRFLKSHGTLPSLQQLRKHGHFLLGAPSCCHHTGCNDHRRGYCCRRLQCWRCPGRSIIRPRGDAISRHEAAFHSTPELDLPLRDASSEAIAVAAEACIRLSFFCHSRC